MGHKSVRDTNCNWCTQKNPQRLGKGARSFFWIGGQAETIQTTALLRMARKLRRVLETCCHSDSTERPSANICAKNSQWIIIKIFTIHILLSVRSDFHMTDLTVKMKRSFFQAAVMLIQLYGCTTWMLTKRLEKKLDGNYTRMLRAIY